MDQAVTEALAGLEPARLESRERQRPRCIPTLVADIGDTVRPETLVRLARYSDPDQPIQVFGDSQFVAAVRAAVDESKFAFASLDVAELRAESYVDQLNCLWGDEDRVLLGAKSLVTDGWLEGLRQFAGHSPSCGIVCPLTDDSGILSLNLTDRPWSANQLDTVAVRLNGARPGYPVLPVAAGACVYVKRSCFDSLGGLDGAFHTWQGAIRDLSIRAQGHGWQVSCCDNVVVGSGGSADSSNPTDRELLDRKLFQTRWPQARKRDRQFLSNSPIRRHAELVRQVRETESARVLMVGHSIDAKGGVEKQLVEQARALSGDFEVTVVCPSRLSNSHQVVRESSTYGFRLIEVDLRVLYGTQSCLGRAADLASTTSNKLFAQLIWGGKYDVVHFFHLLNWASLDLPVIAKLLGARVVVSFHDHYSLCADENLISPQGDPCGKTVASAFDRDCVRCLAAKSKGIERVGPYLVQRKRKWEGVLSATDRIVVNSTYLKARIEAGYDRLSNLSVIEPGVTPARPEGSRLGPLKTIGMLGQLGYRKGGIVFTEVPPLLSDLDLRFISFGPVDERLREAAQDAGIEIRGPYGSAEEVLSEVDLAILPSIVEESFSLVLSECWQSGVPVLATGCGALLQRIQSGENGIVVAKADAGMMAREIRQMAGSQGKPRLDRLRQGAAATTVTTIEKTVKLTAALYRELGRATTELEADVQSAIATPASKAFDGLPQPLGGADYSAWRRSYCPSWSKPDSEGPSCVALQFGQADVQDRVDASCDVILAETDGQVADWINSVATGGYDFVGFVESGDRPEAVWPTLVVTALLDNPDSVVAYCDEDLITRQGDHYAPRFKTEFDIDIALNGGLLGVGMFVRRDFLLSHANTKLTLQGLCYDLWAKAYGEGGEEAFVHVPELLYHRLDSNVSRAVIDVSAREVRHLRNALQHSLHIPSAASSAAVGNTVARARVSVAVVYRGDRRALAQCLESIAKQDFNGLLDLTVLDAADTPLEDGLSFPVVSADPRCRRSVWQSGLETARYDSVLLLEDGVCFSDGQGLRALLQQLERSKVACVGGAILENGLLTPPITLGLGSAGIAGVPNHETGAEKSGSWAFTQGVDALDFSAALVSRQCFEEAAALAHGLGGPYAEIESCIKLQEKGFRLVWTPLCRLTKRGGEQPATSPAIVDAEKQWLKRNRLDRLANPIHHNPNLGLRTGRLAPDVALSHFTGTKTKSQIAVFAQDRWASGHYRALDPFDALARHQQVGCWLMPPQAERIIPTVTDLRRRNLQAIYFHNALHDDQLDAMEEYRRYLGAKIIFSLDDLLTDIPKGNPYRTLGYPDVGSRIRRAIAMADVLVVTTEALARAYSTPEVETRILPNRLAANRWEAIAKAPPSERGSRTGKPRIGWAGARQHAADLEFLVPVIEATASRVDWVFLGMQPNNLAVSVEHHTPVPFADYPATLVSLNLDIAVAPLQHNAFNRCKSAIKLLEYGMLRLPTIATDIEPYQKSPALLLDNDVDAWVEAIHSLIDDQTLRSSRGRLLNEWVRKQGFLEGRLEDWLRLIEPACGTT